LLQITARKFRRKRRQRSIEPLAMLPRLDREGPELDLRAGLGGVLQRVGRYNQIALFQESCE
jgi:hypothetical protein